MRLPIIFAITSLATVSIIACSSEQDDGELANGGSDAVSASCDHKTPSTPPMCPEVYQPVCGCDNATYGNKCEAAAYVSSYKQGACESGAGTDAGKSDAGPACALKVTKIQACAEIYSPVCGCDGKTYGNACDASQYVTSWSEGECATVDAR